MAATSVVYVLVFSLLVLVNAQINKCVTDSTGVVSGTQVQLPRVNLPPTAKTWNVSISQPCTVVGVIVNVCDVDSPPLPEVDELSLTEVLIKRNVITMWRDATVDITVFCATSVDPDDVLMVNRASNSNNNHVWM